MLKNEQNDFKKKLHFHNFPSILSVFLMKKMTLLNQHKDTIISKDSQLKMLSRENLVFILS